jgi:hypothetical protein
MATVELVVGNRLPAGTEVDAYADTSVPPGHTDAPQGSALATGTVDSTGTLTFDDDDLVAGGRYVAAADVDGTWVYVQFNIDAATDDPVTQSELDAAIAALDLEGVSQGEIQTLIDDSIEASEATTAENPEQNVQTGTTYTAVEADAGNFIVMLTNNSEVTVTLPSDLTENDQIEFAAMGTAGATFVAGAGATVTAPGGLVDLPQNCRCTAWHLGAGEWLLAGPLA